jgi:hypothetical protein
MTFYFLHAFDLFFLFFKKVDDVLLIHILSITNAVEK